MIGKAISYAKMKLTRSVVETKGGEKSYFPLSLAVGAAS